ncbi:TetR/AcrR family transcriptional regulator [Pseudonocardia sp. NPDC049154]|uniref:TetR/AcrR family transcriptional regulator n=1 Tax=Pseudonocardia sp. NPDC049154 TaxID=3155501 RepID=UPI00340E5C15
MTTTVRRRRGAELERAIRRAVLALVTAHGPAGVTMEAVAAHAGTSKPVLYRRWPDRSALLRDTLLHAAGRSIPTPDTGTYRGDLLAVLRGWAATLTSPASAPVVAAIVGAMQQDAELREAFRESVIGWRKAEMARLIRRGIERGELRPDVPVEFARELGQGVLWHRFLITGDPIDDEVVVRIVDEIVMPFVAARPEARP